MKHHYNAELSDFNAKLLMQQTPNTNMVILKDCSAKFYDGPLPCTKSVTVATQDSFDRETQTVVKVYEELQDNELKKHRAILFPATYLNMSFTEPELGDYKLTCIDAPRKHGLYPVNLYNELTSGNWRGYRVLPGFEGCDFVPEEPEAQDDDDISSFVSNAMDAVEHEVKRPRTSDDDDGYWAMEDIQEFMQGNEGELYDGQDEMQYTPNWDGNQNLQNTHCYACQAGLGNQMAHYGGCIPEPTEA